MFRVAVTGMGVITPVGNDTETFWNNAKKAVCGVGKITRFDASGLKVSLDAEVKDFNPKQYYDSMQEIRRSDLFMQYAMAAAKQAVEQSGILDSDIDKERLGVYIGSGIGGIGTTIREHDRLNEKGPDMVSPFFVPMMIGNMAAGSVAIRFGAKGPTLPVITACATSTHTIGEAYRAIRHGYADAVIAGGSEASINALAMAGFVSCQALSLAENPEEGSLPFDRRRGGFVMGEGAGILVLEEFANTFDIRNSESFAFAELNHITFLGEVFAVYTLGFVVPNDSVRLNVTSGADFENGGHIEVKGKPDLVVRLPTHSGTSLDILVRAKHGGTGVNGRLQQVEIPFGYASSRRIRHILPREFLNVNPQHIILCFILFLNIKHVLFGCLELIVHEILGTSNNLGELVALQGEVSVCVIAEFQ